VPFVDLRAQYESIRKEIDQAIEGVIAESAFIGGARVKAFEDAFARANVAGHCVSVANGTDAIYITLRMLGVGPGDEVITAANSWISTAEAVSQTGAVPVFVDIDQFGHIDPAGVERKIGPRTKVLLPVHLYGQTADMDALLEIGRHHGLALVEDCAQSHFAEFKGRRAGSFGVASTFSFYPGKNLGAYGDAGAILTSDADLARRLRLYANHGALRKHEHEIEGINSRLDALQAAILSAKLPHIHAWNDARRRVAALYDERLAAVSGIRVPRVRPGATHSYHLYVIRTIRRDELQRRLADRGVQTAVHYPKALPFLQAYARFGHAPQEFPNAYGAQSEILSLPIYPEMSDDQIDYVANIIADFHSS
jgi:dTDP-4-amino-4,6-dideoxygalactose transaminase